MSPAQKKGLYLALVTMLVSGVSVFVNKFAVGAVTPPLVFTAVKNTMVGVLLISILVVSKKFELIKRLKKDEIFKLVGIGLIGGALPFYLFFTGLAQIPALNAALIHKSLVLWVALLAIPLLKEKLSLWQVGAIGFLYSTNLLVGGFGGFEYSVGELMILAATMLWSVEHVVAKKVLESVDPDIVTGARMGLGSLMLLVGAQFKHPGAVVGVFGMSATQWVWMLVTAVALFAYVSSWYRALKLAPATMVATVLVGATVVTNVLSAVFVTHTWTGEMLAQAVLIAVGVGVFVKMGLEGAVSEKIETR